MNYWLVKSEPFKYSWKDFLRDGWTYWDGVRNYQARNNLSKMQKGDLVLFYHSNEGLEVVGIAKVIKEAYQDPAIDDKRWIVVDLAHIIHKFSNRAFFCGFLWQEEEFIRSYVVFHRSMVLRN
jgi:predicted RNA-binding protein with PUA-like domain